MHLAYITQNKIENFLFFISILIAIIPFSAIYSSISTLISLLFITINLIAVLLHLKKFYVPNSFLNVASILFIIYPFLNFSPEDFLLPSIEALTLILSIRLLGKKTQREYLQIYLLSLLLLGSSTLLNMSWIFLLRLIFMLVFTILSILLITYLRETKSEFISIKKLLNLLKVAFFISVVSLPLSALFFFILPRTPKPLIDIGINKGKSGFTSVVNLGGIVSIEEDSSIVMRVKMKKIDENHLYWRVITFDRFDGRKWEKSPNEDYKPDISGERINYTVYLEPSTENYLPTLDFPINIYLKGVSQEGTDNFKADFPIEKTIKYMATSFINPVIKQSKPSSHYLNLPTNFSNKIKELTDKITENSSSKEQIVKNILSHLSNYQYSLKNLPSGINPVEDFLFNKKSGNCEYFATSMALMLRIKGIPSRVVGGFKGGSYNDYGGYYLIRASDAHLWVEAWIDGKWQRFDPSGRIGRYSESVVFNFIDYIWNSIVLDYDVMAQLRLAKSISPTKIKFNKNVTWIILVAILIVFLIFKVIRYLRKIKNPLIQFFAIMKKYGFERKKSEGLREFLNKVEPLELKVKAEKFIQAYEKTYFKDKEFTREKIKELRNLLREINENNKS